MESPSTRTSQVFEFMNSIDRSGKIKFTTLMEEILATRFLLQKKLSGIEDPKIASFAEEIFVS